MNNKDFLDIQNIWNNLGHSEVYWSVLTHEEYKQENISKETLKKFYDSGKYEIEFLETILNKHGYGFKDKSILEFGCGVGRLLKPCLDYSSTLYGVDISESHLKIAKEVVSSGKFFLVDDFKNFPETSKFFDIIFSVLVLQHIRPNLMKRYILSLLKVLKPEGVSLLHVPYFIKNYTKFSDNQFLIEMHYLEEKEMISIIESSNCRLLEKIETNKCGDTILDCIYVIKKDVQT